MDIQERRHNLQQLTTQLRVQLNMEQQMELRTLERFGWGILFIRKEPGFKPFVVLSDGEQTAILLDNGELDEKTPIRMRTGLPQR